MKMGGGSKVNEPEGEANTNLSFVLLRDDEEIRSRFASTDEIKQADGKLFLFSIDGFFEGEAPAEGVKKPYNIDAYDNGRGFWVKQFMGK